MSHQIVLATKEHVPATYKLLKEFAVERGVGHSFKLTEDRLYHLFETHGLGALLAYSNETIIGIITFYETISTFSGDAGLHIEDMYIHPDYQRKGIGKALLDGMIDETKSRGYAKLEWQCAVDNPGAMEFYKKMGAVKDDMWKTFTYYIQTNSTIEIEQMI